MILLMLLQIDRAQEYDEETPEGSGHCDELELWCRFNLLQKGLERDTRLLDY